MTTITAWHKHVKEAMARSVPAKSFTQFLQHSDPQRFAIPLGNYNPDPPGPPPYFNFGDRRLENPFYSAVGEQTRTAGYYTPAAQARLSTLGITQMDLPPNIAGVSYRDENRVEIDPAAGADTVRHEFGHQFDHAYNITASGSRYGYPDLPKFAAMHPAAGIGVMGALRENAFLGTVLAEAQLGASEGRDVRLGNSPNLTNFPGMFGNPRYESGWGGRAEFYARLNEAPGRYIPPAMRQFFPQFNASAYGPNIDAPQVHMVFADHAGRLALLPVPVVQPADPRRLPHLPKPSAGKRYR